MAVDLSEKMFRPISLTELQRRWAETRKAMANEGVDCLVMQSANDYLGMYVRWFIDVFVENGYPITVVFDAKDDMTVVSHGSKSVAAAPPDWLPAVTAIKRKIGLNYFLSCNYTNTYDAEAVVEDLKARKPKKVGWVGKAVMSVPFYEYIVRNLEGVEFVDFTDQIDRIQVVKSDEEIARIKECAQLQDEAWAEILNYIRPGMRESEIRAELVKICLQKGSEAQWIMIGSAPPGQASKRHPSFFQNRILRPGDQVSILIEVNGPGGYYTELARTACLGTITDELVRAWEISVEAQKLTAKMLVPGAKPADIARANDDFLVSQGYSGESRIYAHGQGYNLVERPLIRADEPMTLTANMNITVHPFAVDDNAFGNACDNYIITEDGTERIHKTPFEIFKI